VREGGEERGWFGRPHAWEREEGEEREREGRRMAGPAHIYTWIPLSGRVGLERAWLFN